MAPESTLDLITWIAGLGCLLALAAAVLHGRRRQPTELEWLRDEYAAGRVSMLELENQIERALELGDAVRESEAPRFNLSRYRAELMLGAGALVVWLVIVVRVLGVPVLPGDDPNATERRWIHAADRVCDQMNAGRRTIEAIHGQGPLVPEISLEARGAINRDFVRVDSASLRNLRGLGVAPNTTALSAINAWEKKIVFQTRAAAAAEHNDSAGFERMMWEASTYGAIARDAFKEAGASTCSSYM